MNYKFFLNFLFAFAFVFIFSVRQYAQETKYPEITNRRVILEGDSGKWDYNKVHTLSVVEVDKGGYRYWGYYGLSYYDSDPGLRKGGLVRSNDLIHWDKYEGNPIIPKDCRWPTVVVADSVFYMFYGEYNKNNDSRIVMLTSKDGIHFNNKTVVVSREVGTQNQNPFIFFNKHDGYYYLTYYHGVERSGTNSTEEGKKFWQIMIRRSKSIQNLANVKAVTLLTSDFTIASPSIAYYNNKYYLLIESINPSKWGNKWVTLAYESKNIEGGYTELTNNPVLADNDACAFQYVLNNNLYIFYSHCLNLKKWNWELMSVEVKK